MEEDFHRNFGSILYVFGPFSGFLAASCSFWHDFKDLFLQHKLDDKVVLDR